MAELKLTKTELRIQQLKLTQLRKYLPTLQLKKALLQLEVNEANEEILRKEKELVFVRERVECFAALFSDQAAHELFAAVAIQTVQKNYENIAGIDIPLFEKVIFTEALYSLFDTPVWLDSAIVGVKELIIVREQLSVCKEKKRVLEKELREVSIRVNLFEKIMIPRALGNIRKIRIFLGDQQLASVAQAKVAKRKILERKKGLL
ncbi:MAG: V-type ATP synthase subunit D [Anaplasmataceae bacterium]|nr:V-type ATP synthase subunit D [Anaplasmataceae bacterium]